MPKLQKNNILKYLLLAILIAVPLYPKFPLFFIPGISVAVRLEDILILITILVWITVEFKNIPDLFKNRLNQAIFLFLFIGLLGVFSGAFVTKTLTLTTGFLHWARRAQYISLFFIARSVIKSEKDLRLFLRTIFVILIYAFLYGAAQKYLNLPVITTQNREYSKGLALFYLPGGHLVSTFAGHYDLASVIILFAPFLYVLLFSGKAQLEKLFGFNKSILSYLIIISVSAMGLWLLVHAASRISIVSYMLASIFSLILIKKYKYIPVLIISVLLFINFSSNLMSRYMNLLNINLKNYVSEVQLVAPALAVEEIEEEAVAPVVEDRSTSIRLNVEWPRALRALQKNPILGTGYSSITLATDNDYLRALGETGLFGFAALALVFINIVYELINKIINSKNLSKITAYAMLAVLPAILINMLFIDILEASKFAILFWLFIGLSLNNISHES